MKLQRKVAAAPRAADQPCSMAIVANGGLGPPLGTCGEPSTSLVYGQYYCDVHAGPVRAVMDANRWARTAAGCNGDCWVRCECHDTDDTWAYEGQDEGMDP